MYIFFISKYKRDDCPSWLDVNNKVEPDVLMVNPKKSRVFEIRGFEFSESSTHTATDAE